MMYESSREVIVTVTGFLNHDFLNCSKKRFREVEWQVVDQCTLYSSCLERLVICSKEISHIRDL